MSKPQIHELGAAQLTYAFRQRELSPTQRAFARVFEGIDYLLTLTRQITANRLDETSWIMKLTRCFNMTAQPAVSIPCSVSSAGLPIGLQRVCDRGRDEMLLAVAERLAAELV